MTGYDSVSVVLRQRGADILNDDADKWNLHFKGKGLPARFKADYRANDVYSTNLYGLMETFGSHLTIGHEVPFKDNEVTLVSKA